MQEGGKASMLKERLKTLREERGLKPKDVADLLGMTRQGYCRYEDGKSDLSTSALSKLADFYEVTTDYLLGRDNEQIKKDVKAMTDSELDKALFQGYMDMDEKDKKVIRKCVLEMAKKISELDIDSLDTKYVVGMVASDGNPVRTISVETIQKILNAPDVQDDDL